MTSVRRRKDVCLDMMLECIKNSDTSGFTKWKKEYDSLSKD